MRALIWKEVRELLPAFVLILGAAITLGIADVWYNWDKERFVGISLGFCWLISMAAALLGGANVMARESRGQLSFLGCWPVSRARLWAVKVTVTVVMLALLLVLIHGACCGLLKMRGHDAWNIYTEMIAMPQYLQIATLVALFGFTLMLSMLLRSAMAAAGLGILFGAAMLALYLYLAYDYLPARWGPWLGMWPPHTSEGTRAATFIVIALLAVVTAGWGFMRTPLMESWRRVGRTFGTYGVLVGAGFVLTIATLLFAGKPALRALDWVQVSPTGHWVAVAGIADGSVDDLWLLDVEGKRRRLICRGPVEEIGWSPGGDRLFLQWGWRSRYGENLAGPWDWVVEVPSGHMRRLGTRAERYKSWDWYEAERLCSPKGSYVPVGNRTFLTMMAGRAEYLDMPEEFSMGSVIGWAPDESGVYWYEKTQVERPTGIAAIGRTVIRVTRVPQVETRTVAELAGGWWGTQISPDGRWLVSQTRINARQGGQLPPSAERTYRMILRDLTSGQAHYFDDLSPVYRGWTPDGKHIWTLRPPSADGSRRNERLKLVDLRAAQIVRTIGDSELNGQMPSLVSISPRGDRMYVLSYNLDERDKYNNRYVWAAKPDGSDLRMVGKVDGSLEGWTHDGDLVIRSRATNRPLIRLDLDTGKQRVILAPER